MTNPIWLNTRSTSWVVIWENGPRALKCAAPMGHAAGISSRYPSTLKTHG